LKVFGGSGTASARVLPPRAAYELWADTYPAIAHNPLMRAEQEVVEPLLAQCRARRALDVGTGSGRYLPLLASSGASTVVGVDFSLAMLARGAEARREYPVAQREYPVAQRFSAVSPPGLKPRATACVCADACRLPFRRGTFDLINASLMVGDVPDLAGWSREMARALSLGGHLVYSDFHPSWAQHGWSRTFRAADGAVREIPFHAHAIEDHLTALHESGFHVLAIREPRFKDDGDRAVKAFRRRWRNPRVIVVFHAIRER
jgi:malonyl-CoA O-methyltransferase